MNTKTDRQTNVHDRKDYYPAFANDNEII